MYLYSDVITSIEFRTDREFKVDTRLALTWFKSSDNNYHASDRTAVEDEYYATITTYGTKTYINNIILSLDSDRNYIKMSGFATNENIFGADIDYTNPMSGYITDYGAREAISLSGYKLDLTIKAINPTFLSLATFNWETGLTPFEWQYKGDETWDIKDYYTYSGKNYRVNHNADEGVFVGNLTLSNLEMGKLRQRYRMDRDTTQTVPISVIDMFGVKSAAITDYSFKLTDLSETRFGLDRWRATVTMSEVI